MLSASPLSNNFRENFDELYSYTFNGVVPFQQTLRDKSFDGLIIIAFSRHPLQLVEFPLVQLPQHFRLII
jgi:hypothetical protein